MARFYPLTIELDGKRYKGDWCLMQGNRVCVRSAYGSQSAEVGRDKLETVAAKTLERIVRADLKQRADWRKHQEREMARLSKPRRTRGSSPPPPE